MALDSGIHARMTGLIVSSLKTNILPGAINTFTVTISHKYLRKSFTPSPEGEDWDEGNITY